MKVLLNYMYVVNPRKEVEEENAPKKIERTKKEKQLKKDLIKVLENKICNYNYYI